MNMRRKLQFVTALICFSYLIMGAVFNVLFYGHQRSLEKMTIAQGLVPDIFEWRYLADEYAINRSERAREQWFAAQKNIKDKLSENRQLFSSRQEEEFIKRIEDGMSAGVKIFDQMYGASGSEESFSDPGISIARERRLSSQLSSWTQESISAAVGLSDFNNKGVIDNFRKILYLFLVSGLFLFIMLSGSLLTIWRCWKDLYAQKTKNEAILGGIGDGIVVIDRSWNIALLNKAAGDLCGWSQSEAIGRPFREVIKFIREKDREENIEFIERAMLFGKVHFMENHTLLIRRDGREMPVGDSAAPLFSEVGTIVGAIIIFRDVSVEREANMLKSDFAYASHQFRTPVGKALWGLEAALEELGDKDKHENIKNSLLALKSVNKLVQELLEISEIDQGQIIPVIRKINLYAVIRESVDDVREIAEFKNMSIDAGDISSEISVNTDPRLLKRCLYEILNNAIFYGKKGSVIPMTAESRGGDLILKISDSGIGVVEKEQPLLFNKFFRGSNFNTTDIPGAGLGLYIVKNYITLLKGKTWFKSRENSGTDFFISLPSAD